MSFVSVDFPRLRHAHGVNARQQTRAANAGIGDLRRGRNARRFFVHAPDDAIQSGALARGNLIHHPARGVQHFDLQLAEEMARTLVVGDHGRLRRVVADKDGGAIRPAAVRLDALLHRPRRNKARLLFQQVGRQRAQRRDVVDDPDAATVRPEDKIVIARMNRQVAHGDGRETAAFELRPGFAAIDGNKQTELGPEEQAGSAEPDLP